MTEPRKPEPEAVDLSQARGRQGIFWEFIDFLLHNKLWWMTPIVVVILLLVAFILFAESSPVLPFVYTVI